MQYNMAKQSFNQYNLDSNGSVSQEGNDSMLNNKQENIKSEEVEHVSTMHFDPYAPSLLSDQLSYFKFKC